MSYLYGLTVNYLKDPCGVDENPRFSYKIASDRRADSQARRRILVATDRALLSKGEGDVWDSGFVESNENVLIPYEGAPLAPVTRYYYSVTCETVSGEHLTSEPATFVTGKLGGKFAAKWISLARLPKNVTSAQYLRKEFSVGENLREAYLTICGLGYFESYINGKKTGEDILSPAYSRYDAECYYMQYDVTAYLAAGENAIGVALGNGFYNGFTVDVWNTVAATWRNPPKMICELKMTYADGRVETLLSDTSWRSAFGPITFTGIRNGEYYDARLELGAWTQTGYDDGAWQPTKICKSPGGLLIAHELEPIRVYKTFKPVKKWKTKNGWAFDIGQNIAGFGEYVIHGPAGSTATFRYSDMLTEDMELDFYALTSFVKSGDFQTDRYTKKSDEPETWHPIFVYHGFQYIEISGIDYEPSIEDVTGVAVHSDFADIGEFSCSDDFLNRVQHLCRWSTISNMQSVPLDDPHREKNSWTGDTMLSSEQMLTNFDMRAFLSKWSRDIRTSQRPAGQIPCVIPSTGWGYYGLMGPDWSSALWMIPWNIYLYNGDMEILRKNYDAIRKNIDFMETMTEDLTLRYGTGDWCAPFIGPAIGVNMGSYRCPVEVSDTGFFYRAACTMAKLAHMFEIPEDIAYYEDLALRIRKTFREKFFDAETFTVKGDCQTATGVMLYFGLYDDERERVGLLNKLLSQIREKDDHLDFGVLGNKFVMHSLGAMGYGNVGHKMLAQRTFPGVGEWISRGATTLWECWNGGGSHNHHMFSDMSSFLYKYVAGIAPDEDMPGFRRVCFRPAVSCGMTSASAVHESMHGKVACAWENGEEKHTLSLTIPFGCEGVVYLADAYAKTLSENGVRFDEVAQRIEPGVWRLLSGSYSFSA